MIKPLEKIFFYWNRLLHEPTAEALAELEAVKQLITDLEAREREIGHCILCKLPDLYCIF